MAVNIGGYNGSSPYYVGQAASALRNVTSQNSFSPGYSGQSGFDVPAALPGSAGASTAVPFSVGPARPVAPTGGGDLLSKIEGLIQALGSVVKQLGEFIKGIGLEPAPAQAQAPQAEAMPQAAMGQAQTPGQSHIAAPMGQTAAP